MEMNVVEQVRSLIDKAVESDTADAALKFSQAACNAANAMMCVSNVELPEPKTGGSS